METTKGKVFFVSAGPGDPDLITIKAWRHLQSADVILTDRLVSEDILRYHASPGAQIVRVGKQSGRANSTPQIVINELLVHYGRDQRVVRLKGGDAAVFSNLYDELQILHRHGIPYEIVPGVTAALGAAAYTGIPLTARGFCSGVRLLTSHDLSHVDEAMWSDWASTTDTLVFYMPIENLTLLIRSLTAQQISPLRKLAIVEQATTPKQQVHVFDLFDFVDRVPLHDFVSPSLVIIGSVVSLHERFDWFIPTAQTYGTAYFSSLTIKEQIHARNF